MNNKRIFSKEFCFGVLLSIVFSIILELILEQNASHETREGSIFYYMLFAVPFGSILGIIISDIIFFKCQNLNLVNISFSLCGLIIGTLILFKHLNIIIELCSFIFSIIFKILNLKLNNIPYFIVVFESIIIPSFIYCSIINLFGISGFHLIDISRKIFLFRKIKK